MHAHCLVFARIAQRSRADASGKPEGYVSDFAGVLSGTAEAQLEALATEIDQKAHAQLAVITVKSLEGQPIEDFSIALATKWGIGNKAKKGGRPDRGPGRASHRRGRRPSRPH